MLILTAWLCPGMMLSFFLRGAGIVGHVEKDEDTVVNDEYTIERNEEEKVAEKTNGT